MLQDTQQVYDITYNNCIASYADDYSDEPPTSKRSSRRRKNY